MRISVFNFVSVAKPELFEKKQKNKQKKQQQQQMIGKTRQAKKKKKKTAKVEKPGQQAGSNTKSSPLKPVVNPGKQKWILLRSANN